VIKGKGHSFILHKTTRGMCIGGIGGRNHIQARYT